MKRILSFFLAMTFLLSAVSAVQATSEIDRTDIQVLHAEDGGYVVIELHSSSDRTRSAITKTKSYTRYNENDVMLWKASITGSFTYDGRTASCTSSSCSVTIYDSHWYTISKTAWTDENYAKATVEMGRKLLGVTTLRQTYDLSILCDRYGNLS